MPARQHPLGVTGAVLALVTVKASVLTAVGRISGRSWQTSLRLAALISQGGEFAFVLFRLATGVGAMTQELADALVAVVTLSMAVTPVLYGLLERMLVTRNTGSQPARPFDVSPDDEAPVIIAGFGRVGQVVGRVLAAKRIAFTALDASPDHIEFVRRFGADVYYGDASRLDLLRAARCDKAQVFVLAIDDVEASVRTAKTVREHFPHLTLVARARNRQHAYRLRNLGIEHVMRETLNASLEMTHEVLQDLGLTFSDSRSALERFREHDESMVRTAARFADDETKLMQLASAARKELQTLFEQDASAD